MGLHLNSMNIITTYENLPIYEDQGILYLSPTHLAEELGYKYPSMALNDFRRRNPHLHEIYASCINNNEFWEESLIYEFLFLARTDKAAAWRTYIAKEVLPAVRKVGLEAIKEMAAVQTIAEQGNTPEVFETLDIADPEGFARKT